MAYKNNPYRVIQLTNKSIPATLTDAFMPLGVITRKVCYGTCSPNTFTVTTTGADTVIINECGNYNITYNVSAVASEIGNVEVTLLVNGIPAYVGSATATAAGDIVNVTIPYQIRVLPNSASSPYNVPVNIQIQNTGVGTDATSSSNLLIERVY